MNQSQVPHEPEVAELYRSAAEWGQVRSTVPLQAKTRTGPAPARRSWVPLSVVAATAAIALGAVGVQQYPSRGPDSVGPATGSSTALQTYQPKDGLGGQPTPKVSDSPTMAASTTVPTAAASAVATPDDGGISVLRWQKGQGCGRLVEVELPSESRSSINLTVRRLTEPSSEAGATQFTSPLKGFSITPALRPPKLTIDIEKIGPTDIPIDCRPLAVDSLLKQSFIPFVPKNSQLVLRFKGSESGYQRYLTGQ